MRKHEPEYPSNSCNKQYRLDDERGYIAITSNTRNQLIDQYRQHPYLWYPSVKDFLDRSLILNSDW